MACRLLAPTYAVTDSTSSRRRWLVWALRALVLVLVCLGVSGTVRSALGQLRDYRWDFDVWWMVASAVIYVAALAPMAWFMRQSLVALGERPGGLATLRAYYLSHLGKYVPGKAMVIILRAGALKSHVASLGATVVATVLETLTLMCVGAALGAVLAAVMLQLDARVAWLAVGTAIVVGLPTLPPVARRLTRWVLRRRRAQLSPDEESTPAGDEREPALTGITLPLLAQGWLAAGAAWVGMGLSLWALLRSLGIGVELPTDLPLVVAAVSLAVVAGFMSFLPSGLIVRDAILLELLATRCGDADALVAAVLLRLLWLVSEVGICAILYVGARGKGQESRA